ncbi:response regulator [Verrucomicrobiota bacterium]
MVKKKVLIIDDEVMIRRLMTKLIEEQEAEAVVLESADQLMNTLESSNHFAMAITDLILPYISGWEIIKLIRDHSETLPIAVMTGATLSSDEKKKILINAQAIVEKNKFNIDEFRLLLKSNL